MAKTKKASDVLNGNKSSTKVPVVEKGDPKGEAKLSKNDKAEIGVIKTVEKGDPKGEEKVSKNDKAEIGVIKITPPVVEECNSPCSGSAYFAIGL